MKPEIWRRMTFLILLTTLVSMVGISFLDLMVAPGHCVTGPVPDNMELSETERGITVPEGDANPDIDREDPNYWIQKIYAWLTAIEQHVPGVADAAAIAVESWEEDDLLRIMLVVEELTKEKWGQNRYSSRNTYIVKAALNDLLKRDSLSLLRFNDRQTHILKRGVLLHTDIALLRLEKGDEEDRNRLIQIGDGRGAIQNKGKHMEYARRLLSFFPSDPLHKETKRQWYISTTAFLLAIHDFAYAEDNLQYALEIYPSDATILFYAGTLHEHYALPEIQNALVPSGTEIKFNSKKSELKQARKLFQKAIKADPSLSEARLHLGRVLGLLGDHDQAVEVLQQASGFLTDYQLRYYCSLFLGKELTILNRHEEARNQYEHAAMLYPTAPSPLLGLSRLDHINGNYKNAFLGVAKVIVSQEGNNIPEDPWWLYDVAHVRNASELIYEMYKKFRGQPK